MSDQPAPRPRRFRSKFWDDLAEDMRDPEFRVAFERDSQEIQRSQAIIEAFARRLEEASRGQAVWLPTPELTWWQRWYRHLPRWIRGGR